MNENLAYLFLDDIRQPIDVVCYANEDIESLYIHNNWIVVRNYQEFIEYFNQAIMPDIISFDHDLGNEKSGYDCAKFLVDYLIENKVERIPEIYCHSMNPVGKENILGLFWSFKKHDSTSM